MTTKELINQNVIAHAEIRWMDASELEALLSEFAEKLMANQPKTREALFREYMQATPAERRKFDLSFLDETRKEALAVLTDLGYECKLPQEPALNRADIINSEQYKVSRASVDWYQAHQDADCLDGFEAGAQWQREQMMKDAIEATALNSDYPTRLELNTKLNNVNAMDEVKVIIIRSE